MTTIVGLFCVMILGTAGFYVMRQIDLLIKKNKILMNSNLHTGEDSIRIAFENPIMVESIILAMEKISQRYKNFCFYLYTGTVSDIMSSIKAESLDMAILMKEPAQGEVIAYKEITVPLVPAKVSIASIALVVEPLNEEESKMSVIWREKESSKVQREFIKYLQSEKT